MKTKEGKMPTISEFFGIMVLMFYNDHAPPHFHARYGEYEALVQIDPPLVIEGRLPPRVLGMVIEWATAHRKELLKDWNLAENFKKLEKIAPLE